MIQVNCIFSIVDICSDILSNYLPLSLPGGINPISDVMEPAKSASVGCGFCRSVPNGTGTKINYVAKKELLTINLNHFLLPEVTNIQ